jgi:Pyruvate/2-oxoacid:ferredoxin oxidoreductase delta subunit
MVIGRKIRNFVKWPALQLKANSDRCLNCRFCSKNCPMNIDVNKMVHQGNMENMECTLCLTCAANCKGKAIQVGL